VNKILIFGAGKSATELINYIGSNASVYGWTFVVADAQLELAEKKVIPYANGNAVALDVTRQEQRIHHIQEADIVISLLPPSLHIQVARDCIKCKKNLLTASYIDAPLRELEKDIQEAGVLFLCEMGLDPGIDHMSAMEIIHRLKKQGAQINAFLSHCGGLIAPESDNNPWHYKISWNPRNIVLAGSAGAIYKEHGEIKEKKYQEIFANCQTISVPGFESYAWYPNRDSMSYIPVYQLENIPTFIRTTLRHEDFCRGWNILVRLGLTDPTDRDILSDVKTYKDWIELKASAAVDKTMWKDYLATLPEKIQDQISYLELDSDELLPKSLMSSADILQHIIENKWILNKSDKDMIIMQHEISYKLHGKDKTITSTLLVKGESQERTAMAKTVGLPLGIAAKLILEGKIKSTGLKIPTEVDIYEPVLKELKSAGISFYESVS
jgi:saccharopine dehydrogenase-like NADP-dependent oxidoreductase